MNTFYMLTFQIDNIDILFSKENLIKDETRNLLDVETFSFIN